MSRTIVETLLDETVGRADRGIVCFLGDPQWGKTTTVIKWSEKNDRQVIRLLAQTMEPETICGYDVKHPTTGKLVWQPANWGRIIQDAKKGQKFTLFIDEMDKAREANLTSLLTLLCDRMIQNWKLPDDVTIVCAMNPAKAPLPPALVERLLFVQYPTQEDLDQTILPNMGILRSIAKEYLEVPKVVFPIKVKNAGTVFRMLSWTKCQEFWSNEDLRHTIVCGLVPTKDIPWWTTKLDPKAFMGVDMTSWAENARPSDIRDSLIDLLNSDRDQQKRYDVLKVLCERANADPSGEVTKVLAEVAERMHEVK